MEYDTSCGMLLGTESMGFDEENDDTKNDNEHQDETAPV